MEYQLQRENPIAVFDSGVGGISVLRELIRIMPEEDFIYFGDSKNAPYGTKEKEKVRELTIGCARKLFDQGAKGLVVVREREAFVRAACQGIGRARAFGCGLLQIVPCL